MYITILYTILLIVAIYIISLLIYILGSIISKTTLPLKELPSVSIIIAVKNGENALPKLLNDLKNQTYKEPCEFIIVDDQSTDSTKNIIKTIEQKNKQFRYTSSILLKNPSSDKILFFVIAD